MKIRQLDLLAFGPFTDLSLKFESASYGLHLVCGPNEAGKSSALRALRQVLFGIPHNSSDNFLHPYQTMRIGALFENAAGDQLHCIRRKGRSNTLRGIDDTQVIDPTCLRDLIGGIDEATFCQRFGIDYQELRQGGEAVAQGGGDLGEMLFAAGTGIADLGQVQQRLSDEASELFLPNGSKPSINTALSKLKEARGKIEKSQLPTSEWVKHDKALRHAAQRKETIDEQLLGHKSEHRRLSRIDEALPLIARRQQLLEHFAKVANAASLPDEFSGQRGEAVTESKTWEQSLATAERTIKQLRAAMTALDIPQELLAHRSAITRLHTELGSFQKAARDRPGLKVRLEQSEQQAQSILRELGREPNLNQAEGLRIKAAQREKIQSLAGDCKVLLAAKQAADKSLRDLRDEIRRVELQFNDTSDPIDPSELNRVVRRVHKRGDLDQQLDEARGLLRQLEDNAEVDLQRLRLWNGTLETLERLPVPALETVDRFESEIDDARSDVRSVEQRIADTTERLQQLDQKLETLRLEQDVPTEDDLLQARQQRDDGWKIVLQAWRDGVVTDDAELAEFVAQFAPGSDLAQAFSASVDVADQIGDRLRREADRVAEKATLTAAWNEVTARLDEQQQELTRVQDELEALQRQWRDEWTTLHIIPLSPREMRSWLNQQAALVGKATSLRKQRDTVESLEELIRSQRSALNQALSEIGRPANIDDETLAALLGRCESIADDVESAASLRGNLEQKLRELRTKLTRLESDAEQASTAVDQWRIDWAAAVAHLGLDRDSEPSEANLVIKSVDDLFAHIKDAEEKRARIEGIDRDAEHFTASVTHLLSQVATDLLELPVDQAVADLNDRLEAASTAQTKLDGWNERLQQQEAERETAKAQVLRWKATLETMCHEAGCVTPDELPQAEARSAKRKKLADELRVVDEQLVGLAGGAALDDFIADAFEQDADQVTARMDYLNDEIRQLEKEKSSVSETIGAERTLLGRMDGSDQAAEAQEQVEHLLARIRSDAEQYIRLRVASAVLRKSIERFREQSQGPVLQRASDLFGELTLGSFSGLRADYNDKGDAVLVGVRPDGQRTVSVQGMSEGTCDQLYLALRLSLLESYLAHNESIPFIVDDILIMFDDDRAVAALKTLARLSKETQVIFFTHHEHLMRLATENLDDNLFIHLFDHRRLRREAPTPAACR